MRRLKLLVWLFLLVACSGQVRLSGPVKLAGPLTISGGAAASVVQAFSCQSGTTTCNTSSVTVTTGNWIVECQDSSSATATNSAWSIAGASVGTQTNGYTLQHGSGNSGICSYATITAGGTGAGTCTWSAGVLSSCVFYEIVVPNGVDVTGAGTTGAASNTYACPISVTTVHSNALAFCFAGSGTGAASAIAAGGSFTFAANATFITAPVMGMEYQANITAGTALSPFMTTTGTTRAFNSGVVVFY